MKIIKISLRVKSPTADSQEKHMKDLRDDILEAVQVFNDKFRDWSKRIIITQTAKRAIHLMLVMEKSTVADNLSVREIRLFTQYLRNTKNWDRFTREKHKMFETGEFYTLDEPGIKQQLNKVQQDDVLVEAQAEDIQFLGEYAIASAPLPMMDMEDEDILTVLEYIIKTQDKGSKSQEKKADILAVKSILSKWL